MTLRFDILADCPVLVCAARRLNKASKTAADPAARANALRLSGGCGAAWRVEVRGAVRRAGNDLLQSIDSAQSRCSPGGEADVQFRAEPSTEKLLRIAMGRVPGSWREAVM